MDIPYVLFDANGRLAPRPFWRGLILLMGAGIFIQITEALVSPSFGLLRYALIYPYVCVFSKRLHDGGHSGWFYLLFLLGFAVLSSVLGAILLPFVSPDAFAIQNDMQKLRLEDGFEAMLEQLELSAPEIARLSVTTTLLSFLATNIILGFVAANLKPDSVPNRYGQRRS